MTKVYEYRHAVGLEETNALGNVYFTAYLSWQGRCRELFLREHAPEVFGLFRDGFRLVTTRVECDFHAELEPADEVVVRMRLEEMTGRSVTMGFDYLRPAGAAGEEEGAEGRVVARGRQEIASMRVGGGGELVPVPIPDPLRRALEPYR